MDGRRTRVQTEAESNGRSSCAEHSIQWRSRQQGLLDYLLWQMPTMKEKVDTNSTENTKPSTNVKKKTPRLLFDDPKEWEECADNMVAILLQHYYTRVTMVKTKL